MLVHNAGYLWLVKQRQFLERAEPTEKLVEEIHRSQGQIVIGCFPYAADIAEFAVLLHTGRPPESIIVGPKESCGRDLTIRLAAATAQAVAP
jgi:hypothetical protein